MSASTTRPSRPRRLLLTVVFLLSLAILAATFFLARQHLFPRNGDDSLRESPLAALPPNLSPRTAIDTGGFQEIMASVPPWPRDATLPQVAEAWHRVGHRFIADHGLDADPPPRAPLTEEAYRRRMLHASLLHYEGEAEAAGALLARLRDAVEADPATAHRWLATVVYYQGINALRRGEDANCVHCVGAGACILPIAPGAVHVNQSGSREAITFFTSLLESEIRDGHPDDIEVRWLLNLAHMTLGQWPDDVDPRFRLDLRAFMPRAGSEGKFSGGARSGIGPMQEIGLEVGLHRVDMSGGAVMEDFDGDGFLDIAMTSFDAGVPLSIFRNDGRGRFEDRSAAAGVLEQTGGLYLVQTDYDNDGHADLFIVRGAWLPHPVRPSLLRNRGDGTFEDVTHAAGLSTPLNAITAAWADYDNDGHLDLYIPCERQESRLYRNRGDGTFEDVATRAGVQGAGPNAKGATWIDHDNDGSPDLFVNVLGGDPFFFQNRGDGTFRSARHSVEIDGPRFGFSCWAFDYDNDGWLDLLATSYARSIEEIVKGLEGLPGSLPGTRLYRNIEGRTFRDVAKEVGLDGVYATMGSNFADFDGDGFLDVHLATGDPQISTLVPNRTFRNMGGRAFEDVTAATRTGHLQKGHGVACGDWDRDGDIDLLVQTGGAIPGDKYRNLLYRNPRNDHAPRNEVTMRLVGVRTNRAAIGARITVVTGATPPLTIHRVVSTGSSFGANPLEQCIGLGEARSIATLRIRWPASATEQTFHDIPVGTRIEITEFADSYRTLETLPSPGPPK